MTEVPNDLKSVAARGIDLILKRREIIGAGRLLDEMPADRVAGRAHPERQQPIVILVDETVVLCRHNHVQALPPSADMARRLESAHPERSEQRRYKWAVRRCHGKESASNEN